EIPFRPPALLSEPFFYPVSHTNPMGQSFVLLTLLLPDSDTENSMARYSAFLGRKIEVQYRAGDILLPASGTFVADSGRSIFLEQNLELHGQHKHFRWEIPYQYIVKIEEKPDTEMKAAAAKRVPQPGSAQEDSAPDPAKDGEPLSAKSAVAGAAADAAYFRSIAQNPPDSLRRSTLPRGDLHTRVYLFVGNLSASRTSLPPNN